MGDLNDFFGRPAHKKLLSVTFTFTEYSDETCPQTLKDITDIINHLEFQAKLLTRLNGVIIAGHEHRNFNLEVSRTDGRVAP